MLHIGDYVMISQDYRNQVDDIVEERQQAYLKACEKPFVITQKKFGNAFTAQDPDDEKLHISLPEKWFELCNPQVINIEPLMELIL